MLHAMVLNGASRDMQGSRDQRRGRESVQRMAGAFGLGGGPGRAEKVRERAGGEKGQYSL